MGSKSVCLWLSALAIPVIAFVAVQMDRNSSPSIGGGGYDLGPFVYSWLLVIFTAIWSLGMLVTALVLKDRASSMRGFALSAIGAATFVTVLLAYYENLS